MPIEIKKEEPIAIFTDSLSNLTTIKSGIAKASEKQELFTILNKFENPINFYHTKSHVGIMKNEEVDQFCSLKYKHNPERKNIETAKSAQKVK